MNHLEQSTGSSHAADGAVALWGAFVGLFDWLTVSGLPAFIVWGTALLIAWRLYVGFRSIWRKPDRSKDGTHY